MIGMQPLTIASNNLADDGVSPAGFRQNILLFTQGNKYKTTQFTVLTDEQPSLKEFKDDNQSKSYLRMPLCAAAFPPSPAVPSSMDTPSAPRSSSTSLARILPPWKGRFIR